MRKFTILFTSLILSLLISCQNHNPENPNDQEPQPTSPYAVSYDDAVDEVYSLIDDLGMNTKSGGRKIIANHHVVTLDNPYTKSGEGDPAEAPFFHIINFENDEGFAIVSGDNRLAPVLALTESGNFTPGEEIDNPGFQLAYDQIVDYVAYGSGMVTIVDTVAIINPGIIPPIGPPAEPKPIDTGGEVNTWTTTRTGSIIPTKWGQDAPWNAKCPLVGGGALDYYDEPKRKLVGCTAVAVGQIMYYHKYPTNNYMGFNFDWNRMRNILGLWDAKNERIGGPMVTQLLACIGQPENLDNTYGVDGTGGSQHNVKRTFTNMGYRSGGTLYSYMFSRIEESLSRGRPVIAIGYSDKTWWGVLKKGHTWVIDETVRRKLTTRHRDGSISTGYFNLVHCNWGWDGGSDGYFADGIFDIKDRKCNYRYKQEVIMDIYR